MPSKKSHQNASTLTLTSTDHNYNTNGYDPEPFFSIMDLFFERDNQVPIRHHIDSYNQFITEIIPSILTGGENIIYEKALEKKIIRYRLVFEDYGPKIAVLENDEGYMYPHDAMQKKLSYSSPYVATISQFQDIIDIATGKKESRMIGKPDVNVPIAKIPIMVHSILCTLEIKPDPTRKHCKYDSGGYFIINGSEKVVLSVESIIDRKPMVFARRDQNTFIYYVQVRSRPAAQFVGNVQTFSIKIKKDNSIVMDYKQFKEISIFTLLRALGLETDQDIMRSILDVGKEVEMLNFLNIVFNNPNNTNANTPLTTESAVEFLINSMRSTKIYSRSDPELEYQQKKAYLMKILSQYILPHVTSGTNDPKVDMLYKGHYICYMIHKLLKCYLKDSKDIDETRGCDDRDAMYNKRIETTGILLGSLFEQSFKKMLSDCGKIFRQKNVDDKNPPNIVSLIKSNTIEQGLRQALSQGIFGSQARKGLSQMFSRLNHLHSASYLRRTITPTADASTNKMTAPRHLHVSHFNKLCPLESPEGPKTGLMKHLTLLTSISIAMNSQIPIIMDIIKKMIISIESVNKSKLHSYVKVFVNGNWIGLTSDIIKMHNLLREKRFRSEIERTVSLVMNYREKEFKIYTEGGRLIAPYLTVDSKTNTLNFKPEMLEQVNTWDELLAKFPYIIEYLDCEEELNMMLAIFPSDIDAQRTIMSVAPPKSLDDLDRINRTDRYDGRVFNRYTHCLIHPCSLLGTITSNIPFTNHNIPTRGIFGYNQQKQAMGLYISDYRERTDNSYILYHTQVPIVASRASKYTGSHVFPAGENSIVAVMSYDGWNQEDAIIMNGSSVDRGFMRALNFQKRQDEIKKNPATSQPGIFTKPDRNKTDVKDANYEKLSPAGYVKAETQVEDGDVLIGMINPKASAKDDEKPYSDASTIYKSAVPGTVDRVFVGYSGDGYQIIKMRVRAERIPIHGDKFSSLSGQKGTCGMKYHRADMPYTEDGIQPDMIINPNGINKRMTIGQLVECLFGKLCAIKGISGDGTPFMGIDLHRINDELVAHGMEEWGNQTMYCGMTGKKLPTKIFIGPTYYQRLKQMVGDKVHSRSSIGPRQLLTRQPSEGRTRDGGLRLGEMERDALAAHGAAQMLKERSVDNSDTYTTHICDICGLEAHKIHKKKHFICKPCNNTTKISKIVVPYAFMLLNKELQSMNILPRIRTSKSIDVPRS